ncbi:MAG: hypothetical protein ACI92Z_000657 [Paracoccaceae bacterium]|jgi:hypothetical protein
MHDRSVLKRHAALVDQMAETLGVDLQKVALSGELLIDEISDAVLSCADCSHPDSCQGWTGEHKDGATQTPDYCRNREMFHSFRQATVR